ncbi:hypothetical protein H072_10294 [Dactylellina haptotyla CBS 200.50]|uniref:Uncharacterized protein n=1 Tax=Dactylellina haptotyla (strain CBS 200.50) TaxID=1284197 RepID=S8A0K2_DACHA|nr:hypothetical protein H072_10294 [Dactylellina haptotyla CBS 200.50]
MRLRVANRYILTTITFTTNYIIQIHAFDISIAQKGLPPVTRRLDPGGSWLQCYAIPHPRIPLLGLAIYSTVAETATPLALQLWQSPSINCASDPTIVITLSNNPGVTFIYLRDLGLESEYSCWKVYDLTEDAFGLRKIPLIRHFSSSVENKIFRKRNGSWVYTDEVRDAPEEGGGYPAGYLERYGSPPELGGRFGGMKIMNAWVGEQLRMWDARQGVDAGFEGIGLHSLQGVIVPAGTLAEVGVEIHGNGELGREESRIVEDSGVPGIMEIEEPVRAGVRNLPKKFPKEVILPPGVVIGGKRWAFDPFYEGTGLGAAIDDPDILDDHITRLLGQESPTSGSLLNTDTLNDDEEFKELDMGIEPAPEPETSPEREARMLESFLAHEVRPSWTLNRDQPRDNRLEEDISEEWAVGLGRWSPRSSESWPSAGQRDSVAEMWREVIGEGGEVNPAFTFGQRGEEPEQIPVQLPAMLESPMIQPLPNGPMNIADANDILNVDALIQPLWDDIDGSVSTLILSDVDPEEENGRSPEFET